MRAASSGQQTWDTYVVVFSCSRCKFWDSLGSVNCVVLLLWSTKYTRPLVVLLTSQPSGMGPKSSSLSSTCLKWCVQMIHTLYIHTKSWFTQTHSSHKHTVHTNVVQTHNSHMVHSIVNAKTNLHLFQEKMFVTKKISSTKWAQTTPINTGHPPLMWS